MNQNVTIRILLFFQLLFWAAGVILLILTLIGKTASDMPLIMALIFIALSNVASFLRNLSSRKKKKAVLPRQESGETTKRS